MKHNQPQSSCKLRCCREEFKAQLSGLLKFADEISQQAAFPVDQIGLSNNCNRWLTQAEKLMTDSFTSDYFFTQMIAKSNNVIDNGPVSNLCQMVRLQAEYLRGLEKQINSIPVCFCCIILNSFKNLFGKKTMIFITFLTLLFGFTTNASAENAGFYEVYMTYSYSGNNSDYTYKKGDNGNSTISLGTLSADFNITSLYLKFYYNNNDWSRYGNICGGLMGYNIGAGDKEYQPSWSWSEDKGFWDNFHHKELSSNVSFTVAKWDGPSGNYTFSHWFKGWGSESDGSGCGNNWYINNNGSNYKFSYTIAPPAVSNFGVTPSGAVAGTGTSSDPFIMPYNGTLTLTVNSLSQAHTDANSSLSLTGSVKKSSTSSISPVNNVFTVSSIQNTSSTYSVTITAKYHNSTADLDGAESTVTYYFKTERYDVTLMHNDGTQESTSSGVNLYGNNLTKPNSLPSRTGYTLNGFYDDATGSHKVASSAQTPALQASVEGYTNGDKQWIRRSATTLYAGWTANTYRVYLNKGGSSSGVSQVTATYDADMPSATAPSLTGYDFAGYFDGQNGTGTKYYNNDMSSAHIWDKAVADVTLYAYYTPKSYTITLRQTSATTQGATSATVYYNTVPTQVTSLPSQTGYTFGGYETNEDVLLIDANGNWQANVSGFTDADGKWIKTTTATLDPIWNPITTTVTLKANGGTGDDQTFDVVFDGDINTTGKTAHTRTGYDLKGYFTAATGGSKILDENLAVRSGSSTIDGWLNTSNKWKNPNTTADLFAQWTAHQWTITLDDNEGTGGSGTKTATYGSSSNITKVTIPTRENHSFAGYYSDQAGEGVQVYDVNGALVASAAGYTDADRNWIKDEAVTLYAKWNSVGNYVVTLNNQSATTAGTTSVNVQINTTTGLDANITCPEKTGYTFGGYFTQTGGNGTKLIDADGSWVIPATDYIDSDGKWIYNGNVTLNAYWIANVTNVTFEKNGGTSGTNSRALTYNSTQNLGTITITKTGYIFGGYFTGENGTGTQLVDENGAWIADVTGYTQTINSKLTWVKTTTDPLTLYAKWIEKMTTVTLSAGVGGTIAPTEAQSVGVATSVQVTATPASGYSFEAATGWAVTGNAVKTDANPTTLSGNGEAGEGTLTATFTPITYTITYEGVEGANNPNTKTSYTVADEDYPLQNASKAGYVFIGWTCGDAPITSIAQGSTGDKVITATFAPRFYLRGSSTEDEEPTKGMPGWGDAAKTDGLFSSIDGNTATITMTLEASTTYKLKLGDLQSNRSWGGDHEFKSGEDLWAFTCNAESECAAPTFNTAIAGNYTFTIDFSETNPKIKIDYPEVPDFTLIVAKERIYEETPKVFISGNGTQANPYKFYLDEEMTLTATALAEIEGVTAYYKFGEDAESSETLTKTIKPSSLDVQSIDVKAYYKANIGSYKSAEKSETIYYQGVAVPALHLHSSLTKDEVEQGSAPENVTIYYTTDNYSDAAAITKNGAEWKPSVSGTQQQYVETLGGTIHKDTYVATATPNGRTFTTSLVVSVYKYVQVKVKDADPKWASHLYMWNSVSGKKNAEWPGEALTTQLGDWYIFAVKYPTYDKFVVNDGKTTGKQTIDLTIPAENICYEIGAFEEKRDSKDIYNCASGECPNKLYVGDIADVAMYSGESATASPVVQLDPTLDEKNLQIAFSYSNSGIVTATQSGTKIMLSAINAGTTTVTATYSIAGATSVAKTFTVTVTGAVMIQAKYSESGLGWTGADMHIHYWGTDINETIDLTWKGKVGGISQVYARIPLDKNNQINFQIYAWNMDDDKQWHITKDVTGVTKSGCYEITSDGDGKKRNITRTGDYCWAEYQVKIVMNNGTVYTSNTISDTEGTLSFFAPCENATGYNRGDVYLMCNGSQAAVIPASTFKTSGVYTAKTNGSTLTDVALYTGDYYIRTDGASGGWNDYKNPEKDNKFTTFDKIETSTYDRYWVKNIKPAKDGDKVNLQACVGNDYNENLANKIVESNYTDGNGDVTPNASGVNLRFGYDPATNNFERAIIKGSATAEFLNVIGDNVYKEQACTTLLNTQNADSKFEDKEQWIYEKIVYVQIDGTHISSEATLQSKAFNGNVMYQLGYTIDAITGKPTSTPKTFGLIAAGTTNGTYAIKLVYDFKTNRMVSGWSPSDNPIEGTIVLDADMLLVRNHQDPAAQIKFANDKSAIQQIHHIYGVMQIEKATMQDANISTYARHLYWISFPFDVKVSSIFGVGTYGVEWKLQRYDGAERASKGWFKGDGTTTFWKDMTIDDTMNAFEGYILSLKPSAFDNDNCPVWSNGRTVATFYFPSVDGNVGIINQDTYEQTVLPHECKIDREFEVDSKMQNHKITDSHWNVIGIPTFEDANVSTDGEPHDFKAYYSWKPSTNTYDASVVSGTLFNAMHAYMVQFCGKIIWTDVSVILKAKAPYTYTDDKNYTIELFFNGNGAEDHTYVKLADGAHADFELNEDMMKIDNAGFPNIYSFAGNYNVAYNETEMIDQVVTIGVSAPKDGSYTFAMPKDFSGSAILVDLESGEATDLNLSNYTVELNKGTYNNRFQLLLEVEAKVPTSIQAERRNGGEAEGKTQKLLRNGNIYLINGGRVYNVLGAELR